MARTVALWLTVLTLLASVFANPLPKIKDLHATSLDLYAIDNENDYGRFAVRVERVDQVVDVKDDQKDEEGKLLAARIHDVVVVFDVGPKGNVLVNGVPVPMGMSNLKIEADVVTGVTAEGEKFTKQELASAFDTGLIGMKVHVAGDTASNGQVELTRLVITEEITEVNGKEVVQNNAIQQVIEIHPDGSIVRQKPCAASGKAMEALKAGQHHREKSRACLGKKIAHWFHKLPYVAKVAFSVLFGVFLGATALAISHFVLGIFSKPAIYAVVEEQSPFIAAVTFEPVEDDKLPIYTAEGYAAVDTKEKKEDSQ
ncbi:hypothetical protein SpCBS45565_g01371 [Spizellomyces sp. 'palustris']|nr:hypothetical protein SpCBS45565_g01371 [Spizellomyces sp. 'palustris']